MLKRSSGIFRRRSFFCVTASHSCETLLAPGKRKAKPTMTLGSESSAAEAESSVTDVAEEQKDNSAGEF
jgi:hypothetical protein